MNYKKEYKNLLETVKSSLSQAGKPHRNEDVAKELGYNRSYFSQLLGEHGTVTAEHVRLLKLQYKEMLETGQPGTSDKDKKDGKVEGKDLSALIKSNADIAESNKSLAFSNAKLVTMLEQKVITSSDVNELLYQ